MPTLALLPLLCLLSPAAAAESLEEFLSSEAKLLQHLFMDYDATMPATYTRVRTDPAAVPQLQRVNITLMYSNLLAIDQPGETISLILDTCLEWSDYRLKWTPADFNGIDLLVTYRQRVWVPDIVPYDIAKFDWAVPPDRQMVVLRSDGRLSLMSSAIIDYNCELDMTNFPFDDQICAGKFSCYYSIDREMELVPAFDPNYDVGVMSSNSWSAIGKDIYNLKYHEQLHNWTYSEINFIFKLRRSDTYYVVLIIIPSYVLVFLCIAGLFWSKITSTNYMEKLNLGYAGILAMVLILQMTTQEMPKTWQLPILSLYVLMNLSSLTMGSLAVLIVGKADGKLLKATRKEKSWQVRVLKKIHIAFLAFFLTSITINLIVLLSKKGEVRNSK